MNDKKSLRKFYKEKREALYKEGFLCNISAKICAKLNVEIKNAKNILIFCPFGSELNLLALMDKNEDKNFYLPVCIEDKIVAAPYKAGDKLVLNKYKIPEPKTKPVLNVKILDIIITPALCADKNCHRLGYGGGYYDRFFSDRNLQAKKIIVIPDEALVENIPNDEFDIKCDMVMTELRTIKSVSAC